MLGGLTVPTAFAAMTAEVSAPPGSGAQTSGGPNCQDTDECFIPATVTIDVGGEVTWSNDDTAAHTVTSGSAADGPDGNFDSSLFMVGTTFSWTFAEAGEYPYFCMVHPWMVGTVIVEAEGAGGEELMVSIETTPGNAGETMDVTVTITDMDGNSVEHVNYNVMATQGTEVILDDTEVHDHDGVMTHTTMALPMAASDEMPVDVSVEFLGFGIDKPFTGPIGYMEEAQVVPEFGTIAMMILGVAIVSIIAISAKSRVIPRI
ncbi:MAG TPA: PEFG-CTERM sorting domain-containing protein [Nitrosopumilus sp.]|nr:PEFG-CTERM sorting domain-containing protein [Nitrosopumilus sp.]